MSHFRDHADAMRVIGATFVDHALSAQPSQSWMVRRQMADGSSKSAYHFVVTWVQGRALIVTGDLGGAVYSGITHLASIDDTVRIVHEASMDYLTGKSTHKRKFDREATARHIVEMAYGEMRGSFDPRYPPNMRYRHESLMCQIVDWYEGGIHGAAISETDYNQRKDACRALLDSHETTESDFCDITEDWECIVRSWPPAAHWHYEALRTWADLMAKQKAQAHIAEVRKAATT